MEINNPATLAEVTAVFGEYEQALVSNDVEVLDRLFWNSIHTLRYGAGENLYGFQAIQDFRNARPSVGLERSIAATSITTFGSDFAVANVEFTRSTTTRIGRQTQTWVRLPEGWRVVAAHVSLMDAPKA
jgi:hypothetical protein